MKRHLEFLGWWSTSNPRVSPPSTQDTPRCQHGGWDDQGWKWQNHDMQKGRWRENKGVTTWSPFPGFRHNPSHQRAHRMDASVKFLYCHKRLPLNNEQWPTEKQKKHFCGLSEHGPWLPAFKAQNFVFFCQINQRFWDPSCERHPHHDWRPLWDLTSCSGRLPPAGHQAHHPGKGKKDAHNRPR